MIITNFPKNILINILNPSYLGADYIIYKLDSKGCKTKIVASGIIENESFKLQLPDGKYKILSSKDSFAEIELDFIVYYNYLCEFVNKFLKVICCECCDEALTGKNKNEEVDKLFFEAFINFQCLGVLDDLKLTQNTSCRYKDELKEKVEISQFYGTFNFDYTQKKKEILQTMYIDFYKNAANSIKADESDIEGINSLFQIEKVEKCLYKNGIDFSYFSELYNKLNCKTYE